MTKLKMFAVFVASLIVVCASWAGLAAAYSFHTGPTIDLSGDQPVHQTVFAAGRTLNISTEVFGDVFCAGQTVTVSGTIHGDLICAGQTLQISGKVDGDVRLAGQIITLGAKVTGNATVAGDSFIFESAGQVGGDMSVGSTDAILAGKIGRDAAIGGDSATVSGSVGRDITGTVTQLHLGKDARVSGNIDFTSKNGLDKSASAVIGGKVTRSEPVRSAEPTNGEIWGFRILWFSYWLGAFLLLAMALVIFFPRLLQSTTNQATPVPWKALLVGFLASISVPFIFVLLAMTVVGIPLAIFVLLLWLVLAILSGPVFAYYVGRMLLRRSKQPLLIMLSGASLLVVAWFIPFIGFIASFASFFIGSGMLLLELFRRTPKPKYHL